MLPGVGTVPSEPCSVCTKPRSAAVQMIRKGVRERASEALDALRPLQMSWTRPSAQSRV